MSRPTRARGLKRIVMRLREKSSAVAPHAGAWIETERLEDIYGRLPMSRPTRARGLKPLNRSNGAGSRSSRPTRARGLKRR